MNELTKKATAAAEAAHDKTIKQGLGAGWAKVIGREAYDKVINQGK
jgi:hypothetical protein